MCTKSACQPLALLILIGACSLMADEPPFKREAVHNVDLLLGFDSTNAIVKYFKDTRVPFRILPVPGNGTNYYWIQAAPYTGVNTIDLYCFYRHGTVWRVQMLYFALSTTTWDLDLREEGSEMVVYEGNDPLVRVYGKPRK